MLKYWLKQTFVHLRLKECQIMFFLAMQAVLPQQELSKVIHFVRCFFSETTFKFFWLYHNVTWRCWSYSKTWFTNTVPFPVKNLKAKTLKYYLILLPIDWKLSWKRLFAQNISPIKQQVVLATFVLKNM